MLGNAIPGMSSWVLQTIKQGYSLQFARTPPCFKGVVQTSVQDNDALRSAVSAGEGSHKAVLPENKESGSHHFLIPKTDGGLRPILDFSFLNCSLMRRSFKMLTLKQILVPFLLIVLSFRSSDGSGRPDAPVVVPRPNTAVIDSSLADSTEERPPFSSKRFPLCPKLVHLL